MGPDATEVRLGRGLMIYHVTHVTCNKSIAV